MMISGFAISLMGGLIQTDHHGDAAVTVDDVVPRSVFLVT
jgi:hypothetical protein